MKKLPLLLSFALLTSTISHAAPTQQIKQADSQFQQFKKELNAYIKCLKGDKDCDKHKLKQLKIAAAGLIATTLAIGAVATTRLYRAYKQQEKLHTGLVQMLQEKYPEYYFSVDHQNHRLIVEVNRWGTIPNRVRKAIADHLKDQNKTKGYWWKDVRFDYKKNQLGRSSNVSWHAKQRAALG